MTASSSILDSLAGDVRGSLRRLFSPSRPVHLRSAPGRVDVLGGLAVETGGTLAQMALPRRAAAAVQLRDDSRLVLHSDQIVPPVGESELSFDLASLAPAGHLLPPRQAAALLSPAHAWAAPFLGLLYVLAQGSTRAASAESGRPFPAMLLPPAAGGGPPQPRGFTIALASELAPGASQASSTALTVGVLLALADATALQFDPLEAALIVHRAENLCAATVAHVTDVLTCLHALDGAPPHLLRFSAQPHQLVGQVPLPGDLRLLALDTGVRYTSAAATLQGLRLAGAMGQRIIETIYRDLGQRHTPLHGHLANVSPSLYRQYFRALLPRRMRGADFIRTYGTLPERAGPVDPGKLYPVRTAVDHLLSEHEHAENFLQAMEELSDPTVRRMPAAERRRTLRRAGRLMLASHHSYRLRLELSCREADCLVDSLMESGPDRGIYGARITGAGGGGTVVALLDRSPAATEGLLQTLSTLSQLAGLQLGVVEAGTAGSLGALQAKGLRVELE